MAEMAPRTKSPFDTAEDSASSHEHSVHESDHDSQKTKAPKDKAVCGMAAEIMRIGDRHSANNLLSELEVRTFVVGTQYDSFARWLLSKRRFHTYDSDGSGALGQQELYTSLKDYLTYGEASKGRESVKVAPKRGAGKKMELLRKMHCVMGRRDVEDGAGRLEVNKEVVDIRKQAKRALKNGIIERRDIIEAGLSELFSGFIEEEDEESDESAKKPLRDPPPYGDSRYGQKYWDTRNSAAADVPFDWYMDYNRLGPVLRRKISTAKHNVEVLDLGFGMSELPSRLHGDGWTKVTAIDYSPAAVSRARGARRHAGLSELKFLQMDACKLTFPNESFDVVIDKALFDTVVCSGFAFTRATELLSEVYRVLKPSGLYFLVSHAGVAVRLPYLAHDPSKPWRIELVRMEKAELDCDDQLADGGSGFYHIYICTKPTKGREVLGRR